MPPEYRARIEAGRPRLVQIAKDMYGIELKPGTMGWYTRPALIGAKYAESNGIGAAYHAAIMRAYWTQAADLSSDDTLADIAVALSTDRAAFLAALHDPAFDAQVQADIDLAREYGLDGVPALVFDEQYLVSGAQPLATLERVVDKLVEQGTK